MGKKNIIAGKTNRLLCMESSRPALPSPPAERAIEHTLAKLQALKNPSQPYEIIRRRRSGSRRRRLEFARQKSTM